MLLQVVGGGAQDHRVIGGETEQRVVRPAEPVPVSTRVVIVVENQGTLRVCHTANRAGPSITLRLVVLATREPLVVTDNTILQHGASRNLPNAVGLSLHSLVVPSTFAGPTYFLTPV
jgi:hypothetical protein